jgi:Ca-activated chloride channel family protein
MTTAALHSFLRSLQLGAPAWLWLLALTPALFLVAFASLGDFTRAERVAQAILRTLVLAGLALALAQPTVRRDAGAVSAVALVDVSDSVSEADLSSARALVRKLEQSPAPAVLGRALPIRVVRFAATPAEVIPTNTIASDAITRFDPAIAPGAGAATDLALATGLGSGLFDPAGIPRLLLISDGEPTDGDVLAAAERAAARGIRIDVHTLGGAREQGDVAVETLTAPDEIHPHAPFELTIRLLSDRAGEARLHLERDGKPNLPEADRTVSLAPGITTIPWTTSVEDPGTALFRVRITGATHDAHAENDAGVLAVATEADPRVLFIEGGGAGSDTPLARALGSEHIAVDVRAADEIPARPELDRYDLVVLSDVARAELGDKHMGTLDTFVRAGGGLLVAGGAKSFGAGNYGGSRLEAILPVRLDLPEKDDEATLALALVIDKSGSMGGPKMELTKEAARATAEMMPPSDLIAVIVFDSMAAPVVRLQRAANRARILGDISRIQASGGTNILAGLREAFVELLSARARKKHVILLSDGQSGYDGISDLLETASGATITVSAVGVGEGADQTLLQMIATRGGGRFYHTRDPASIPRIFSKETSQVGRTSVVEEPTRPRVTKHAEMLGGVSLESAPPLRGYALTRPRAQADLILATSNGDPLLARWQIGLGQVAAWTSDVKSRWSADWLRWPGFGKFWAQVARTTMRRRAANHFPLKAVLDGATVSVTVDAVGADDKFLGGLDGSLEIVTASVAAGGPPAARHVGLAETAPGRYEASFPIDRQLAGALLLRATLNRGTLPVADATGRLAVPFAPELRPRPAAAEAAGTPSPTLAAIAARTGGREVTEADVATVLDPGSDRRSTLQPIRTQVLLVTLALFLIDVLLRRVSPSALFARLRGKV